MLPEPPLFEGLPEPYFSQLVGSIRAMRRMHGGDLIDLARGNPDVPPPAHVIEALREAALDPLAHGYAPFAGLPALQEALADHQRRVFGVELDPEREVVTVPGTKTGIVLVCMALAGAGEGVLVPDPGYPDYFSGVGLAGARVVPLPLDPQAGFAPAWDAVDAGGLADARMAFLNYPSNPCGTAATGALFEEAVERARRHGLAIVHDLAYGELVYGGHEARSFLATPGGREVGVELVSMSKTYGMAGWRVGFVTGNEQVVARVRTLLDHLTAGIFMPLQRAAAVALRGPQESVAALRELYGARMQKAAATLGLEPSDGSYYLWWRMPDGVTVQSLMEEARVAVAPGAGFGERGIGWARVSVSVPDDQLDEGLERIRRHLGQRA